MDDTLQELLVRLAERLPGCLHTSVIDEETGLALASVTETDPLDAAGVDAFHNDLYRLAREAVVKVPGSSTTEGMVISGKEAAFISSPVASTGYLWLVVTSPDATVGFTQAMMRKHLTAVEESLEELLR